MLRPPWNIAALGHRLSQVLVDLGLVAAAYWLAYYVRFDGDTVPARYERAFAATVLIVIAVKMALFVAMRFYTKWWRFTSVRDLQAILLASVGGTVIITALFSIWRPDGVVAIPRGVLALDLALTIIMVGGARFVVRSIIERPAGGGRRAREVLICGAGEAGNVLLREMTRNRQLGLRPVGLIDDDPRKRRLRVQGARVRGTRADLARILRETPVDEVIIAMPSATGRVRNEIVEICRAADVPCRTLPGLDELITGGVRVSSLREVRVEDVLGRDPVETDFARVARYLNGRAVLVTGAGGSIGRELCRQIVTVGARRLIMVDHAENNLFEIDMELRSRGTGLPLLVPVIADCKDVALMERVFAEQRPDFVFHAAAYKHVPMMELNPVQAVGNNALATAGLADVAERHGVERFCLISTDKAVEPQTVMGASKALAERVVESRSDASRTRFAAVRFGNVLGSSGSVLPIFQAQIERGGPVTVTHQDMTRYFMTIPEAVQLVIGATGIAEGGDIFVLDMGEPVRIMDLASQMIELSGHVPGRDIAIEVVGIRPGEKLHEELFNVDEEVRPTRYGKIRRVTRPSIDPADLDAGLERLREAIAAGRPDRMADALWQTLRAGRSGGGDVEGGTPSTPAARKETDR
ncbi:MAG: nucleoside-diphosphate sugar epimerase/dehydratase [Miltoncostaeaceae bacterium]